MALRRVLVIVRPSECGPIHLAIRLRARERPQLLAGLQVPDDECDALVALR